MSVLTLEAKLERQDPSTPWGFRMQGGKDFSSPITIARVNPGSLAAKCGLQQGDIILKIGNKACEVLKHKDAQDAILSYGNKLDLLLQRIREKKIQNGYGGNTQTSQAYEKFSIPNIIASYQTPITPASSQGSQSYNTVSKPFGSTAANKATFTPQVDSISQQAQNLNISQSNYSKYADVEDKPGISAQQSRSFKFLADTLESGQEPPAALRPMVDLRQNATPSIINKQFNAPNILYSNASKQTQQNLTTKKTEDKNGGGSELVDDFPQYDEQGKRLYRPSETLRLIQEQENELEKIEKPVEVKQTRTIKVLEKQLGESVSVPTPAPPKAPPAPKLGVWSPAHGVPPAPAISVAKPFTPHVAPVPPQLPRGVGTVPPKPTGVGAMRGRIGDAVVRPADAARLPICASCSSPVRGPFVLAMGKSWCPDHFICANPRCGNKLVDMGFVEEGGFLYCEKDYELYFAPHCAKCDIAIVGECVNALGKQYHPACFLCHHCKKPIGGTQFHLEEGNPYCENDWRQLYQTMCTLCNFPIEPGDKWVEAMNNNYHTECFTCSTCKVNLEGQAFYAKSGKPYCKKHAR